jgi:DNA polymerase-1
MPRAKAAPKPAAEAPSGGPAGPGGPAHLPPAGAKDVLYLVDLSGYVFRAYHALPPLSNTKGEPTHAVLGTVNMLQKVVGEKRPAMLAVAMDSKGRTFRHGLDARYKATRPPPPEDLSQQMARVEEIIRAWNVVVFQKDGLEADDLIAAVAARAVADGVQVVIVSSDKDLMQLVHDGDDRIITWDSMRDRVYGPTEVAEKFGVKPSQVRDLLALTGDTSDNVPGVPGVGPKTASDLLHQFGTLEKMYERLDEVARPKLRESLREHEGDARISQKLVTLDAKADVPWDRAHLQWGGARIDELRRLYTTLEFVRPLEQLEKLFTADVEAAKAQGEPAKAAPAIEATSSLVVDEAALHAVVKGARASKQLGLSLETAGVDALRSAVVGVALSEESGKGHYVPVQHRYLGCPPQLSWEKVKAAIAPALADDDVVKVGHDLKRASITLAKLGAPVKGPIFDTRVAAYLLDPEGDHRLEDLADRELGVQLAPREASTAKARALQPEFEAIELEPAAKTAAPRAELPLRLRESFQPRLSAEGLDALMRDVEMPLLRVLAAMEARGVLCDVSVLEKLGKDVEKQLAGLESECKGIAGPDFLMRSRDQLEKILFDDLKLPVVKRTPKGGRSTDADVLEALAEKHPLPRVILQYRELDKLKGTYIDALPRYVNPETGRIHTSFDQTVAATGRLSSNDPNLQNIPVRTELGRAIRAAFVAPPGSVILSADYSQIELRVLAHLSNDPELIDAFSTNADIHARTAALVWDKKPSDVTVDERRAAKTINFGVIYGMGDSALGKQLGVPREEAAKWIAAYFARYAGVARFMERTVEAARQGEAVRTALGRRRFLPNLHSANRGLRFEAERIARNTPIQGTAADILKLAMVKLGEESEAGGARMILTVHDELVFEVAEKDAKRAGEIVREKMEGAMKLAVPLLVDVGTGGTWAEAH